MTLSITRALVELKTLDSRIYKITNETEWIIYKTKNKNYYHTEEEFKKKTTSDFQSLNDLIKRRNQVKNAIVSSNAVTKVTVGGQTMTVAEAIEYKTINLYKRNLLEVLKKQRQMVTIESENHKHRVQLKIDDNVKIICGKDTKPDATLIQSITDGITKGDPVDIYDPLSLDNVIKNMETEIEDFTANIDYILSESNALTTITV
jgi:hypothetical protein